MRMLMRIFLFCNSWELNLFRILCILKKLNGCVLIIRQCSSIVLQITTVTKIIPWNYKMLQWECLIHIFVLCGAIKCMMVRFIYSLIIIIPLFNTGLCRIWFIISSIYIIYYSIQHRVSCIQFHNSNDFRSNANISSCLIIFLRAKVVVIPF